jgi:inhibitor of cysteine peptidase
MKRVLRIQLILPLMLLVMFMLLTGGSLAASQNIYTGSDNGKTITVNTGDVFTVKLAENPTTGYSWNMTLGGGLQAISDLYVPNATPRMMVGSGGTHEWTIKAVSPGTYTISGIYKRPWEPIAGNETRYQLTVKVVGNSTGSSALTDHMFPDITKLRGMFNFKAVNMTMAPDFSNIFKHFSNLSFFGMSV